MSRLLHYPKASPAITLITAVILACASVTFLALVGNVSLIWMLGFSAALFGAVAVVYGSPLMTSHAISDDDLQLRYGLIFRADLPLSSIEGVRVLNSDEKMGGALDLTTERSRRLLIALKARRRFGHALMRSYREVAISVEDVAGAVDAIEKAVGR
jgi:hypothetical protein